MKIIDIFEFEEKEGIKVELLGVETKGSISVYTFNFKWNEENAKNDDTIDIIWRVPMLDLLYRWTPNCFVDRSLPPEYFYKYNHSMVSYNAPVTVLFNGKSEHKYSWVLSETTKLVYYRTGVRENNGTVTTSVKIPLRQYTNCYETTIKVRIDNGTKGFTEAIGEIAKWWEKDLNSPVLSVPESAKDALYSFWYSYHRDFTAKSIEDECKKAAELGFKTVIVDDGWQTDTVGWAGYEICGDWKVGTKKIPDMKAHVETVHKMGLKYVLWYSVPFMGNKCSRYSEFEGMMLRKFDENTGLLDPRYKKVREFLIGVYKKALIEWNLDGLKLDFIDRWCDHEDNAPYNEGMDIPALQDAVDRLMTDIANELKSIKPDVLIEFRQNYIGPNMRKFGNMFRVTDCPDDYIRNRIGVLDLRLMMENSAVHSDMLMWHNDESAEIVAIQIISILFSVMQYSAKIGEQSDDVIKTSRFWIDFMAEHKDLLLNSNLEVFEPHLLYTWAKASNKDECAVAVYSVDKCIKPDKKDTVYIANGSEENRIIAEMEDNYSAEIFNCLGESVQKEVKIQKGINIFEIPVGGLAILKKN